MQNTYDPGLFLHACIVNRTEILFIFDVNITVQVDKTIDYIEMPMINSIEECSLAILVNEVDVCTQTRQQLNCLILALCCSIEDCCLLTEVIDYVRVCRAFPAQMSNQRVASEFSSIK
jgi:hypothetical protein